MLSSGQSLNVEPTLELTRQATCWILQSSAAGLLQLCCSSEAMHCFPQKYPSLERWGVELQGSCETQLEHEAASRPSGCGGLLQVHDSRDYLELKSTTAQGEDSSPFSATPLPCLQKLDSAVVARKPA